MIKVILPIGLLAFAAFVLSSWQSQVRVIAQQPTETIIPQQSAKVSPMTVTPTRASAQAPDAAAACRVTEAVPVPDSQIPSDSWADPIHSPAWYRSADGKILAPADSLHVGGNKFAWLRPAGAQLRVMGRRLDREAPPMGASIPCCYPGVFQVSGLYFPTGGCWEIEAKVEGSILRFVVQVQGPADPEVQRVHCTGLEDAVRSSDGIILGKVQQTERDSRGYSWQHVSVVQVWKNPYGGEFTDIDLLQRTAEEPLEVSHIYLLFVRGDPFQTVCPNQTLAEVVDSQVRRLSQQGQPLWTGNDLVELQRQVKSFISSH